MSTHKSNPLVGKYYLWMHGINYRGQTMYTVCHVESLVSPGHFIVRSTVFNSDKANESPSSRMTAAREIVGKQLFDTSEAPQRFAEGGVR
jgi:hypothetical protein